MIDLTRVFHIMSAPPAAATSSRRNAGVTVVELMIAGSVMVVVLGIGGVFLSRQVDLQRAVQARNEAQDSVRVVLQVVTQDFSLAGNSVLSSAQGGQTAPMSIANLCANVQSPNEARACVSVCSDTETPCDVFAADEAYELPDDVSYVVAMRYLSSQFPVDRQCRDVVYAVSERTNETVLMRSDVDCDGVPDLVDFAFNAEVFQVLLRCSSGDLIADFRAPRACDGAQSRAFPRTAVVTFGTRSTIPVRSAPATEYTYLDSQGAAATLECDAGGVCFLLSQEILLPNLKDQ